MANKTLFASTRGPRAPKADAFNEAGGVAYSLSPEARLAQYAATGCLGDTFYATAGEQLDAVLRLAGNCAPEFVAKTALYARGRGHMKDVPALLVAVLSVTSPGLMAEVFDRVIDNGRMLRNFVQIMRSGVVARKSLGTLPKRLVADWLNRRPADKLFFDGVGNAPSLADVIKMVHPRPADADRAALFAYLIGKPQNPNLLPPSVNQFEAFKNGPADADAPDVPFQMLTGLPLAPRHWKAIADTAPWQMTRMNLNTFARHGVFEEAELTAKVAGRLRDPAAIRRARVFPYQLLVAYCNAAKDVPAEVRDALQDAMELATGNVKSLGAKAFVLADVSGSMHSPVTGFRKGATTAVRCVDVAALVAATVLRTNAGAEVIAFHDRVQPCDLNPRDSVMTNADKLAALPSGGTNCSAPLKLLNDCKAVGDLVIYVSDNESWLDTTRQWGAQAATETMRQWTSFKARNPRARLVCIDLAPYGTTQAQTRPDVLNVGGFSDAVFDVIRAFVKGELGGDHWVRVIEAERL